MREKRRILANTDIVEILLGTPRGHQHLRATIKLHSGEELILQEATVANLVRAYIGIKTHPLKKGCRLIGRELSKGAKKKEFASWQLLEKESGTRD
ncbi:hypothetical protein [Thalassomonas haliotis]|uniref:Uncharacterized protein n=1 Tax=Thalassomonas haliotis TaxID=485448 RepID=A0ABY7VE23_9GAMM|nr:hypothetical protein [Thalassomonas haliotis]WDE11945.1 hypothetical protein H3N35_00150 [Thalassomonas haliotis]